MEYNAPDNTMLCRRHNDRAFDRAAISAASAPRNMPIDSSTITAQRSPTRSLKRILLSNNNYIIIMSRYMRARFGCGWVRPVCYIDYLIIILSNRKLFGQRHSASVMRSPSGPKNNQRKY